MSTAVQIPPPRTNLATLPIDETRGISGMWCVIATEAMLFVCMFAAYYYLGNNKDRRSLETLPKLIYAFILLVILLSSRVVLDWGERQVKAARFAAGRAALGLTVFLGLVSAAERIAGLSSAMTILFLVVTIVMWALFAWALYRRRGSLAEHEPISASGGEMWIVAGGLLMPVIVLTVLFVFGLSLLRAFPIHAMHGENQPGADGREHEARDPDHRSPMVVGD